MHSFRQGMAAIALVASLGLIVPGAFGGPAAADISNKNPQSMTIECQLGNSTYSSEVIAIDHDPGGKKLGKMQDTHRSLGFVPMEGYVISTFRAIEDNRYWPDNSSRFAAVPLPQGDTRLDGGYPAEFVTPRGYDFSYFGDGFSTGKDKKKLVDCTVTDSGELKGTEATTCLLNGDKDNDVCFENIWVADYPEAAAESSPCLAFGDPQYEKCFVPFVPDDGDPDTIERPPVTYHYTDVFYIKALVTGNDGVDAQAASAANGAVLSAASVSDDGKHRADRQHKAKKGGKHRGKGNHRK
jgi:hypothetical protein